MTRAEIDDDIWEILVRRGRKAGVHPRLIVGITINRLRGIIKNPSFIEAIRRKMQRIITIKEAQEKVN